MVGDDSGPGEGGVVSPPDSRAEVAGYGRSGVVAGVAATVGFTIIHDIFISDIWDMLVVMMVAGALCGFGLAVTFRRLFAEPSLAAWWRYNLAFMAMFGLLGLVSVLVFEPVTSMEAIVAVGGPVDDLIVKALPMTLVFTGAAAAVLTRLFGRGWSDLGPILATVAVLVLFLGLNVSPIGLVDFGGDSAYLIGVMLGLIAALAVMFAVVFALLERQSLVSGAFWLNRTVG